jgi:hypothetical protein
MDVPLDVDRIGEVIEIEDSSDSEALVTDSEGEKDNIIDPSMDIAVFCA